MGDSHPPKKAQQTLRGKMRKNGDSWAVYLAKWALGMLAAVLTAAIIGGAGASVATQRSMVRVNTVQEFVVGVIETLQEDVKELDEKIDAHRLTEVGGNGSGTR